MARSKNSKSKRNNANSDLVFEYDERELESGNSSVNQHSLPVRDEFSGSSSHSLHFGQISKDPSTIRENDASTYTRPGNRTQSPSNSMSSVNSLLSSKIIPGEDRQAVSSTIDESVWETLRRDLLSVWLKMQLVLWPQYLLGGFLKSSPGTPNHTAELDAQERGDSTSPLTATPSSYPTFQRTSFFRTIADKSLGLINRWPDAADTVLYTNINESLRDWDLWGPLLFCLLLSFLLSRGAQDDQKSLVFSSVFALIWIGKIIVTVQIKLLGGNVSFFQSMCIIGYTLFPMVIAASLSALGIPMVPRIPVYIALMAWSLAAGVSILGGSGVVKNRVGLAVYPLFVFYAGIGCLCFVS